MRTQTFAGHPLYPDAVRPGTSAALTARTIDATPPPPLAKAQEAVAAFVPRLAGSMPPPLLGGMLGVTVLLFWMAAQRMRLRPSAVLLSGLLLIPSSFHTGRNAAGLQAAEYGVEEQARTRERSDVPRDLIEDALPLIEMVVPEDWSEEEAREFLRENAERLRREIRRLRRS